VAQLPVKRLARSAHRERLHQRIRRKINGSVERPRLAVYRSIKHIRAQVIDDLNHRTMASASSLDPEVRGEIKGGGNIAAAKVVGRVLAQRALKAGIELVVFDRGGYKYHGRIRSLAEAAREAGLKF
jgi:large subunit ribosomal protein L18